MSTPSRNSMSHTSSGAVDSDLHRMSVSLDNGGLLRAVEAGGLESTMLVKTSSEVDLLPGASSTANITDTNFTEDNASEAGSSSTGGGDESESTAEHAEGGPAMAAPADGAPSVVPASSSDGGAAPKTAEASVASGAAALPAIAPLSSSRTRIETIRDPSRVIVREGFMKKRGGPLKRWKLRFFRLTNMSLSYRAEVSSDIIGTIAVSDMVNVHKAKGHMFTLETSKKSYLLKANSADECDTWMKAFLSVLPPAAAAAAAIAAGGL